MLTRDDLVDIIVTGLSKGRPAAAFSPGPKGRRFLSEYEIKKLLTPGGKRLTIPMNSIISPLALDGLTLQGIEIVRE
ncbi:MAG: hypothetical protein A2V88_01800 [Elusimicrobia bacterium RBG_16_66_12]|nr:MAG: hypothetical protein A2V88_01800 [Elusimicrobia bacterium RBG_16_66_12]